MSKDYPLSPPTVYLLNSQLKHPNVMPDKRICIDIFEKDKGSYKGWKSGYTVLSILLQLQMFFFDVEESFLTIENKKEIQENLNLMAEFKCPQCKHRGSSNPYPDFPKINEQNTKMTQEQYQEPTLKKVLLGWGFLLVKYLEQVKLKVLPQDLILLLLKLIQKKD